MRASRSSADSSCSDDPGCRLEWLIPSSRSAILSQRCRQVSEIGEVSGDLTHRRLALAGYSDHIGAELLRIGLGHVEHPFTVRSNLTGQMSTKVGAIPCVSIIAGGPGALSAVDWAAFLVATPIALVIVVDIAIGIWRKYWRRSPGDLPEPPDGR